MLFNSYQFLFLFFPLALAVYLVAGRFGETWRLAAMLFASVVFYGAWDARFLVLLAGSVLWNFSIGAALTSAVRRQSPYSKVILALGIGLDLLLLGVFKYAHFFADNWNALSGDNLTLGKIILPLGISFFTFEEIGYLVDIHRGKLSKPDLLRFAVFISFFPRLVAGPILRYSEILPQLQEEKQARAPVRDIAIGLTIFFIGLAKKTILADGIAPFVAPGFASAAGGVPVDFFAAWGAALAYTCQLYFDFSGYSDMAIGAARCFGVRFPMNFNSPYKSRNIVEFWRRWHMTLSRFLRDYLYIPLGGNRKGLIRRYANLFMTMLLGGLWHGASWTFVAWGGLHGSYLVINHGWNAMTRGVKLPRSRVTTLAAGVVTFLAVLFAWVFFRSPTFTAALDIVAGLSGAHGAVLPLALAPALHRFGAALQFFGIAFGPGGAATLIDQWLWIAALLAIALLAPNTQQIMAGFAPVLESDEITPLKERWSWSLTWPWAAATGVCAFFAIGAITKVSEFLYWQF